MLPGRGQCGGCGWVYQQDGLIHGTAAGAGQLAAKRRCSGETAGVRGGGSSVTSGSTRAVKRFKDLFCDYVRCAPEAYEREALKRTLYPRAARLTAVAHWLCSPVCLRVIEEAGEVENSEDLRDVMRLYEYDIKAYGGFWLRRLKFRVSGRRLLDLYARVQCHAAEQGGNGKTACAASGPPSNA